MPDLRALRVAQTTSQLLQAKHLKNQPVWLPTVARIPPSSDIARKPPPSFHATSSSSSASRAGKVRKVFAIQRIKYLEDGLRERFYKEHPWELARPVLLIESGHPSTGGGEWTSLRRGGRQVSGECVVQRQMYLMQHDKATREESYRTACEEFYAIRTFEAIEARIAVEEAMAFGTQFDKSQTQVGLELEDRVLQQWRESALQAKSLVQPGVQS